MEKRFTNTPADIEARRQSLTDRGASLEREWQGHEDNKTRAQGAMDALGPVDADAADRVVQVAAAMGALNNEAICSAAAAVAVQAKVPTDDVQKYVNYHLENQNLIEAETAQKIIDEAWKSACTELDALPAKEDPSDTPIDPGPGVVVDPPVEGAPAPVADASSPDSGGV